MKRFPILLGLALAHLLFFAALELAGLRDWVSVLSGTPVEGVDPLLAALGGALYVLTWLTLVTVAPVLALAELLLALAERTAPRLTRPGSPRRRAGAGSRRAAPVSSPSP